MPYSLLKIKLSLLCKSLHAHGNTLKMHPSRHSCSFAGVTCIAHRRAAWKNQRTVTWYFNGSLIDAVGACNKTFIRYFYMKAEDPVLHKAQILRQVYMHRISLIRSVADGIYWPYWWKLSSLWKKTKRETGRQSREMVNSPKQPSGKTAMLSQMNILLWAPLQCSSWWW